MGSEFMAFLKNYGVIGLAIGVVIGGKVNELVGSIVEGLINPIIGMATGGADFTTLTAGPFAIGKVITALINFLIVAFLVFWFAKKVLREETVAKK
ncbi:MAG: large conductance mechanosensitive channel protein MscL [Gemmatimonadetes bacterium]|nr:large conductance mechanosensitive channel protein MscL [Gemmatimonadota bacterium]